MAITAHWYSLGLSKLAQNTAFLAAWNTDITNGHIFCALTTNSYTPNQDTDSFWSTPQANEVSGAGYTAGGVALTGGSVGGVTGSHEIPLIASASSWTSASFTAYYAVVYRSTGTASTSPLLGYVNFGGAEAVSSGTFTINWDATNGVLALSAS